VKGIQNIFFDVDDTLFDRKGAQYKILQVIVNEFPQLFSGLDPERVIDAFLELQFIHFG
jgi:FMN phosphatase YigB (HAD superfamily)